MGKVRHISLSVDDIDASAEFYKRIAEHAKRVWKIPVTASP
jgi:catechol 2,3-dioxygenase-like lactoylglutathione lyase family enzyme